MKRTFVILAGGKGSRSINPDIPKALHTVNGKTLIENQLIEIAKLGYETVLVVGYYKADLLSKEIDSLRSKFSSLDIQIIVEDEPRGTFGALKFAALHSESNYFVTILGDLFFTADLAKLASAYEEHQDSALIAIHPNTHPHDSDLVKYSFMGNHVREFLPKTRIPSKLDGNSAIAGIYVFSRESILSSDSEYGDISIDFIPNLLSKRISVRAWITVDVIMDSGTPERIQKINQGLTDRTLLRRSSKTKLSIFLDLDDTLVANVENKISGVMPRVSDDTTNVIKECNEAGVPLIVVSNQPGVAKGFFSLSDLDTFREIIESQLADRNAFIDAWYFCPHHPESGWEGELKEFKIPCECRKPGYKMLLDAKEDLGIDIGCSVFVGDSLFDEELAKKMNMRFIRVVEDGIANQMNSLPTSHGIRSALEQLC